MLSKMSLPAKILFVIVIVLTLFFGATIFLRYKIDSSSDQLVYEKMKETKNYEVPKLLQLNRASVKNFAIDYANWRDLADFAASKKDTNWLKTYLFSPMKNYGIDYVLVFDINGKIKGSLVPEGVPGFFGANLVDELALEKFQENSTFRFYKKHDNRIIEFYGSLISANGAANYENKRGFLFLGREMDTGYVRSLNELNSSIQISIEPTSISQINSEPVIGNEGFTYEESILGLDNLPIGKLKVTKKYELIAKYSSMMDFYLLCFVAVFFIIGFVFYKMMANFVLKPTKLITQAFTSKDVESLKELTEKKDEFGAMALFMYRFFLQAKKLENEIMVRRESQEKLMDAIALKEQEEKRRTELEGFLREQNEATQLISMNSTLSFDEALNQIVQLASKALNCEFAGVWQFSDEKRAITATHLYQLSTDTITNEGETAYEKDYPNYFRHLHKDTAIIAHNARTDASTSDLTEDYYIPYGITSIMDLPIKNSGKVVGILCLEHVGPMRIWSSNEQIFATSLANTIALQFEREETRKAKMELQEHQERLEEAQELAEVGSWEFNFITGIVSWSKQMYKIFEVDTDYQGNLQDLMFSKLHKDDQSKMQEAIDKLLNKEPISVVECRFIRNDGSVAYFKAIGSTVLSLKNKKVIGIRGSLQNITAQYLADKAKSEFLSTMSHEIRTPINGVIGISNLLMDEQLTDKQKEYVRTLDFSAKHLASVVSDILDFSKIESGAMTLEKTSFNLRELCTNIFELYKGRANENNVDYTCTFVPTSEYSLYGDPVRLNQVLTNLISNAIKFANSGKVHFSYEVIDENNHEVKVLFKVEDTGIGISKENQKDIFESFKQANEKIARKFGGTGLGLTICKKLVELQGGTISLESELGVGTTFRVELSFEKHVYRDHPNLKTEPTTSNAELPKLDGLRVLIAEDNKINALVLTRFLQKWNVEYIVATNGREAILELDKANFDLILMDIQMPIMDGLEATTIIRNTDTAYKNIEIVAFTADASVDTHQSLLRAGFSACMTKPFDPDTLQKYLQRVNKTKHLTASGKAYLKALPKNDKISLEKN